ncbi:MAG: hypothetical protein PHG67_09265 [Bacteroidales bacterium]|jgi:hypothetical protein|nr:hypothetical protein [Bacteroidales bacterium]HOI32327.1 hypothetical protein [Bacteroidales bacterium]
MIVIADSRMPEIAKKSLAELAKPLWLEPSKKVYYSISAHPDIFFCQHPELLIAAPEISEKTRKELKKAKINYIMGNKNPGSNYPETAIYNAVALPDLLIHNIKHTDKTILEQYNSDKYLHVNQGYTRCNLISLSEQHFICSDSGILRQLENLGKSVLYIDPAQIRLAGHKHGFFGGCCGICQQQLILCGNPEYLKEYESLLRFIYNAGYQIVSLSNEVLTDVGSLLFIS